MGLCGIVVGKITGQAFARARHRDGHPLTRKTLTRSPDAHPGTLLGGPGAIVLGEIFGWAFVLARCGAETLVQSPFSVNFVYDAAL